MPPCRQQALSKDPQKTPENSVQHATLTGASTSRCAHVRSCALCQLGHDVEELTGTIIGPEFFDHFLTIWMSGAHGLVSNARLIGLMQALD